MKVTQPPYGTPINMSHPLAKGMVGCWLLNEGGGLKAFDSTKLNGLPGAVISGVFKQSTRGGAYLNAANQDVSMQTASSYPNLNLPTHLTISAWINTTTVAAGTQTVVGDLNSGGSAGQYFMSINRSAAKSELAWAANVIVTGTINLTANAWHHVVATRSGATGAWTATLYLNGVLDNSASTAINPAAQQGMAIGRLGNFNGNYFTGMIQTVQMWNRALSATEVRQLYTNPYQMFV